MTGTTFTPYQNINDVVATIKKQAARITIPNATADGLFVLFNNKGTKPPFFWVFNGFPASMAFSKALGSDQPFYALVSPHQLVPGEDRLVCGETLVQIYTELILERLTDAPPVLCGNCQGARIMERVVTNIAERTDLKPLFICMEHNPRASRGVPAAMIFGNESERYNPFLQGKNPVDDWRQRYPQICWAQTKGNHAQYFLNSENVKHLAAHVTYILSHFRSNGRLPDGDITLPISSNAQDL